MPERRRVNADNLAIQDTPTMSTGTTTASPTELGRGVSRLNLVAAALSTLCIIHCLALPLLISVLALSVPFTENETVHITLVLLAAPATLWVIYRSRSQRHFRLFIATASTGLIVMLAGTFVHPLERFEEPMTVAGALILVTAHLWHWSALRTARQTVDVNHGPGGTAG